MTATGVGGRSAGHRAAVQTFLPYPDFAASVAVLDTARLGKQRVETLQILRALTLPEYGWRNHPAVRMWRGRVDALVRYGLTSVEAWSGRGYPDTTAPQIAEFAPDVADLSQDDLAAAERMPRWLGDERLHRSHRSKLLSKDPLHYGRYFTDVPTDLDYFWPDPDESRYPDASVAVDVASGLSGTLDQHSSGAHTTDRDPGDDDSPTFAELTRIWVVQPEGPEALGQFLQRGVVALGSSSGIAVDAGGQDLTGLRQMLGSPTRRVTRPLIALSRFITEIDVGDEVAVLLDGGRRLLVGVVEGPYEFSAAAGESTAHRRRVRWDRVLPRTAFSPMWALQDVRPVFDVRLAPGLDPPAAVTRNDGVDSTEAVTAGR